MSSEQKRKVMHAQLMLLKLTVLAVQMLYGRFFDSLERANEYPKANLVFPFILPYIKDSLLLILLDFLFAVPQIFQDLRPLLTDQRTALVLWNTHLLEFDRRSYQCAYISIVVLHFIKAIIGPCLLIFQNFFPGLATLKAMSCSFKTGTHSLAVFFSIASMQIS